MLAVTSSSVLSTRRSTLGIRATRPRPQQVCSRRRICSPVAALEIDWSDSDTWVGIAGAVLGVGLGLGAPIFYASRDSIDEKRLEELRELNRKTFKETGEYLTEVR